MGISQTHQFAVQASSSWGAPSHSWKCLHDLCHGSSKPGFKACVLAGNSRLVLFIQISTTAELNSALHEALEETWGKPSEETWESAWKIFEEASEMPLEFTVTKRYVWDLLCSQGDDFCLFSLEEEESQGPHE
ncbi:hypothetical protein llap_22390 [Limosa lapponica baueri]|uniref:Uncharacterized protein n=1 Tax=Limosa lapponica baueri TaxID=1758121 RepID=A0A2I0T0J0_LIMLA|nr:hypothetical protein llap_22390 [Limosa lapponica baueri]